MNENAIKRHFQAIAHHTTNKGDILGTLDYFESDEELERMTELLNKNQKMSLAEIGWTILTNIVQLRQSEPKL